MSFRSKMSLRIVVSLSCVLSIAACGAGASRHSRGVGASGADTVASRGPVPLSNRYALVGVSSPSAVQIVDLTERKVLKTIPLAGGIPWSIAITPDGRTAYVTESSWPSATASNDVVPIDLSTDRVGSPIKVGEGPVAIGITPDGRTAYVVDMGTTKTLGNASVVVDDYTVTPVDIASNKPGKSIRVCPGPGAIAITKDGSTAYVACTGTPSHPSYDVMPIDLATGSVGPPIVAGVAPMAIAITPDGTTAYIANTGWPSKPDDTVTPVDLRSMRKEAPIKVGASPISIAITPNGRTAYVVNNAYAQGAHFDVTPIDVASNTPEAPITVGPGPVSVSVSPDGTMAYISNMGAATRQGGNTVAEIGDTITPIEVATNRPLRPIKVGKAPTIVKFLPVTAAH